MKRKRREGSDGNCYFSQETLYNYMTFKLGDCIDMIKIKILREESKRFFKYSRKTQVLREKMGTSNCRQNK